MTLTDDVLPPLDAHSPHCCLSRGCHFVCSHMCRTDLEAIPECREHEYCRRQQPILQLRRERAEREVREELA